MIKSLAAAVLAMGLLALPACNTTAGVGKDVQVVGGAIENAAIKQKK